jgi:hypothetical protein
MSLAAVLHALAQGFEAAATAAEADESTSPAKAPKKAAKVSAAPESAPPAATQPPTVPATASAAVPPAQSPAAPTISKDKLNKAVLAVAGVNRDAAVMLLAKFGLTNTATLPEERYQEVFDAFEEKKAQLDAASVKASLV